MAENGNGNGNGNGSARTWQLIAAAGAVGAVALGAMISFFIQTATTAGLVSSLTLRVNSLEMNYNRAFDRINEQRAITTGIQSALTEIETQFCAEDIVRNVTHSNDMGIMSMLWQQTYPSTRLPTDNAYYPQICNRAAQPPPAASQ